MARRKALALRIVELTALSQLKYTVAALQAELNVSRHAVQEALDTLMESGSIKNDRWKHGYCYRHPTTAITAEVWHVVMRPSLEKAQYVVVERG